MNNVQIIASDDYNELSLLINEFLISSDLNILSIQYSTSSSERGVIYSALIHYRITKV